MQKEQLRTMIRDTWDKVSKLSADNAFKVEVTRDGGRAFNALLLAMAEDDHIKVPDVVSTLSGRRGWTVPTMALALRKGLVGDFTVKDCVIAIGDTYRTAELLGAKATRWPSLFEGVFDLVAQESSRDPRRAVPEIQSFIESLSSLEKAEGVLYYQTGHVTRNAAEQEAARRGRFSSASFGESPHNYFPSYAVDIYPIIERDGKQVVSNDSRDYEPIASRATELGLRSGSKWRDWPHVELEGWRSRVGVSACASSSGSGV